VVPRGAPRDGECDRGGWGTPARPGGGQSEKRRFRAGGRSTACACASGRIPGCCSSTDSRAGPRWVGWSAVGRRVIGDIGWARRLAPAVEAGTQARQHLSHVPHEIIVDFTFVDHHQAAAMGRQRCFDQFGVHSSQAVSVLDDDGCNLGISEQPAQLGPRTPPIWSPGLVRLPGCPDLAPSASSALPAGVLRAPMHQRLWLNDPDCLLLRRARSRLTARSNWWYGTAPGATSGQSPPALDPDHAAMVGGWPP